MSDLEISVSFLSSTMEQDAFVYGCLWIGCLLILFVLLELPFAIRELAWERRTSRLCRTRWDSLSLNEPCDLLPCHAKCPFSHTCPFYEKPRWRVVLFEKFAKKQNPSDHSEG